MSAGPGWPEGSEVVAGVRAYLDPRLAVAYVAELALADPRGRMPYVVLAYVPPEAGGGRRLMWFAGALDKIAGAARDYAEGQS